MNIKWNAEDYTENFSFVHKYGSDVLELLDIEKGMRVIDLGCGNGALTKAISDMGADVVGMDASEDMLENAERLYPNLKFLKADATDLHLSEPVDAIFSNAVFHWIDDHEKLAENLSKSLKKGGQLVCEFGGKGCAETIHSALEKSFNKRGLLYRRVFNFAAIGEFAPVLERHGFKVTYATLFDRPTELTGTVGDWIRMFVKEPFEGIDKKLSDEIISEAEKETKDMLYHNGKYYADYVRIRIKAIKE